jgi:uncharacterized protein (UPF0261 family)
MRKGATSIVQYLCDNHQISGIIAMGGGQGTWLASSAMRVVPIGIPKVLISTIATIERLQHRFQGVNDTMIINSLVDISGLNSILRMIIERGAAALNGMIEMNETAPFGRDLSKKRVAISMWGVTTPCVSKIQEILSARTDCETVVFHATGMGGPVMEHLIRQGYFSLVADITLPEVTIPLAGGQYPKNPGRLLGAANKGIPQIIVPGGVDMIESPLPIPEKFSGRPVYMHNPDLAFVRSSVQDNIQFGREIASRLNQSKGAATVILPLLGLSFNDREGNLFYNPEANEALFETLKKNLRKDIQVIEIRAHINDVEFANCISEQICKII